MNFEDQQSETFGQIIEGKLIPDASFVMGAHKARMEAENLLGNKGAQQLGGEARGGVLDPARLEEIGKEIAGFANDILKLEYEKKVSEKDVIIEELNERIENDGAAFMEREGSLQHEAEERVKTKEEEHKKNMKGVEEKHKAALQGKDAEVVRLQKLLAQKEKEVKDLFNEVKEALADEMEEE